MIYVSDPFPFDDRFVAVFISCALQRSCSIVWALVTLLHPANSPVDTTLPINPTLRLAERSNQVFSYCDACRRFAGLRRRMRIHALFGDRFVVWLSGGCCDFSGRSTLTKLPRATHLQPLATTITFFDKCPINLELVSQPQKTEAS